jgi:hypothetical protein
LRPAADSAEGKRKSNEVESDRKKSIGKKLKVGRADVAGIKKSKPHWSLSPTTTSIDSPRGPNHWQ